MTYPAFSNGDVFYSSDANAIGLWLVKSQTVGSGVSSVTVTEAFSADYDNYKIVVSGGSCSTTPSLSLTLGSTATGYYISGLFVQFGTTTVTGLNVTNGTAWTNMGRASSAGISVNCDIYNPYNSVNTGVITHNTDYLTNGYYINQAGYLANTTSYTAFTITPAAGTLTGGTIRVYGYRN